MRFSRVSWMSVCAIAGFAGLAWTVLGEPNETGKLNSFQQLLVEEGSRPIRAAEVDHNFEVLADQIFDLQNPPTLARYRAGNNYGIVVESATGTKVEAQLPLPSPGLQKVRSDSSLRLEFTGTLGLRRAALQENSPCSCQLYVQLFDGDTAADCIARTRLSWEDEKDNAFISIKTPVSVFADCDNIPAGSYTPRVTLEVDPATGAECRCYIGAGPDSTFYTFALSVDEYQ